MFEQYQPPAELMPQDPRFGAGPSLVPPAVLQQLADTGTSYMGTSHRQAPVKDQVAAIQGGLQDYFELPADYEVVLGNGGSTLLFDMIGLGMVQKRSDHFCCGEFSTKWFQAHQAIPWIEAQEHQVPFGAGIDPRPEAGDLLCATLNETSTGVVVNQWPTLKAGQLLAVDGTSGAGQVPCQVSQTDVFFFAPQKVFASDGGLWVAICSPRAIERAQQVASEQRYIPTMMSWTTAIENSRKHQTYNTPALATLYLLNAQVQRLRKVGYREVQRLGQEKAQVIYDWAQEKPYLAPFVQEERYRSNVVCTIDVDERIPVQDLTRRLRELGVVVDIDAYRKLGRNQLRIATFFNISREDVEKLCGLLSHAIESEL